MTPVRLEVGCGPEWHPVDDGFAVGLDVDLAALRTAAATVVCGDAATIPLAGASAGRIVLRAVLHHLDPVDRALAELARIAAPGASLTIVDGVALPADRAQQMNAELVAAGREPEPLAGFDPDDLAAAVGRHGFEAESVRIDGTATFATRPIVSEDYVTDRFVLDARRGS